MQDKNVAFRQIMSNEKSIKEDLNRFNWFILKDGDQGAMSNDARKKLAQLVNESDIFENFYSWDLPDGSKTTLLKRKRMNESIRLI